eukprot:81641-Chlamydomonas_euryale.AAC.7
MFDGTIYFATLGLKPGECRQQRRARHPRSAAQSGCNIATCWDLTFPALCVVWQSTRACRAMHGCRRAVPEHPFGTAIRTLDCKC